MRRLLALATALSLLLPPLAQAQPYYERPAHPAWQVPPARPYKPLPPEEWKKTLGIALLALGAAAVIIPHMYDNDTPPRSAFPTYAPKPLGPGPKTPFLNDHSGDRDMPPHPGFVDTRR
jgi:hypothetical protein